MADWFQFVCFTVLPVAFRELLHWLYEWQVLVTGILAIVAARMWGRSVVRAARINARAVRQAPLLPPPPAVIPAPAAAEVPARTAPRVTEFSARVYALRELIRVTLGRLPCTGDALSAERLADCRKIAAFPLGEVPVELRGVVAHRLDVLRSKLSALEAVRETDVCRNVWETLVRISVDARDLLGPEAPAVRARPELAAVRPDPAVFAPQNRTAAK